MAILSGQWATYKTTVALDLLLSIMTGASFAGHRIKRRGGVLFLALEGGSGLEARLNALAEHRGIDEHPLPFAWLGECPPLIDKDAANKLCKLADDAASEMKHRFGLPIVVIVVDTVVIAAGYSESGTG